MLDKLNKSDLHRYMKNGSKNKKLNFVAFWSHGLARKYTFTTTFTEQSLLVLHYFFFFFFFMHSSDWQATFTFHDYMSVCLSVFELISYITFHEYMSLCLSACLYIWFHFPDIGCLFGASKITDFWTSSVSYY